MFYMRKLLLLRLSLVISAAAQTTTPYFNFNIPAYGTPNWNILYNANFSSLDSLLYANGCSTKNGCSLYLIATNFPGGDIGAQVNNAAATCTNGQQCHIIVPPMAQAAITTPIVYVANETVECPRIGAIDNSAGSDPYTNLTYFGSGTAITMPTANGRLIGCDLLLGPSVTNGIWMGSASAVLNAYSNHVEDASVRGGGTGTTLVKISCPNAACEDNNLINSRLSDFIGVAVGTSYSNDTHLYNNAVYGKQVGNTTSTSLLIDSQAGGVNVDGFIGGSSGLHGMVVRHTLGGLYPTFGFINNFECDIASSDCILFDSTLSSANIGYTCNDCWAAGAGGAGIHIAGGSNITIGAGSIIRVNAQDGILIDGGAEVIVKIHDNIIQGNNTSNAGYSGISIAGHPNGVTITGNVIGNYPEVSGNQQYALKANSDVEGLTFANNNCSNNVVGCANVAAVVSSKLTYFGNINVVAGVSNEPNYFPGTLQAGTITSTGNITASAGIVAGGTSVTVTALSTPTSLAGTTGANGLIVIRDSTLGGNAIFMLDPNSGPQLIGSSNITGITTSAAMSYSSGWRITLSSGATPRTLTWAIFQS